MWNNFYNLLRFHQVFYQVNSTNELRMLELKFNYSNIFYKLKNKCVMNYTKTICFNDKINAVFRIFSFVVSTIVSNLCYSQINNLMNRNKLLATLLTGFAAGFIAGVLIAPEKGSDTRKKIVEKAGNWADALLSKLLGDGNLPVPLEIGDASVAADEILG